MEEQFYSVTTLFLVVTEINNFMVLLSYITGLQQNTLHIALWCFQGSTKVK